MVELAYSRPNAEQGGSAKPPSELALRFSEIVGGFEKLASERESKRVAVEERWLKDLEQYHGNYDQSTLERLRQQEKSEIFVNLTGSKTDTVEAKLFDMLFPTDDKNWGIEPSPSPELTQRARELIEEIAEIKAAVVEQGGQASAAQDTRLAQAKAESQSVQATMAEARRRCRTMAAVMDDQLTECDFAAEARDVIGDACRLGTGVLKGPITTGHAKRRWYRDQLTGAYSLGGGQHSMPPPVFKRVDPWSFYPDPDARTIEESESSLERHMLNRKSLRRLALQEGFDKDAIRRVLSAEPRYSTPNPIVQLRAITGSYVDASMKRYHVWEYHGPMEPEDIKTILSVKGDTEGLEAFGSDLDDPLTEVYVTAWFCQGEMLYLGPYVMDSNEPLYSLYSIKKDESSLWGFGIPYLMRSAQKAVNGAWRMMMDNAGVATGPQVVINSDKVEPADGSKDYSLKPMKTWLRKSGVPGDRPFETYDIPMHQGELAAIIQIAQQFIDQETAVPQMVAGEQPSNVTKTLGGMALLMNSTNVLFRRMVKNWDDDLTKPSHRRLYDWNMQFHPRTDIKGDYEVAARGTSVLLVREIESQNLMAIAMHFSAHPVLGPLTKVPALYRRLVQTMMVPADEIVMTDEEIEEKAATSAEQPPEPSPDVLKAEVALNVAQIESDTRLQVAQLQHETAMMTLAEQRNIGLDKLAVMLEQTRMKQESDERKQAVETAVTQRIGATGGGFY